MFRKVACDPALFALLVSVSSVAPAQFEPPAVPPPSDPGEGVVPGEIPGEIIVTAPSERGRAIGSGVPDIRIGQEEIASYGAGNVAELLGDLRPQIGEQPVILVNGRRISGMDEISRLPPEAIQRVDILPEEVALNYGYRADQRVVNIVLVARFNKATVELAAKLPTAGGRSEKSASLNLARIDGKGGMSLDLDYSHETPLTEAERDLDNPDSPYRTLMPSAQTLGLGATMNRRVLGDVNATLNARIQHSSGASLFGLPADPLAPAPLKGHSQATAGRLGLTLNGQAGSWNWSAITGYDRSRSVSKTDRDVSGGIARETVRSTSGALSGDVFVNGALAMLPAGRLSTTLRTGIARRSQRTESEGGILVQQRDSANTQTQFLANLNLPITSRRENVLPGIGDLSANLTLGHDGVSGVGGADTIGYGLSWSPVGALRLTATMSHADGLPPQAQREDPVVVTPNVPVHDFVTGQTVAVSRIDGGNPGLRADSRRILSVSGRYKPFSGSSLTLNFGYTRSRVRNQIGALPAVTAAIEAAFPERFTRDDAGQLVSIDARPVNFARAEQQQISWGLFWSKPIGAPVHASVPGERRRGLPSPQRREGAVAGADEQAMAAEMQEQGLAGGAGGGIGEDAGDGAAPHGGRGAMRAGQGRVLLSLNHVWRIRNDLVIRDGLPTLDLLGGDAFGSRGQARHQLNARANLMKDGIGATLGASWEAGSRLKGSTSDIRFSDLAKVDLRLFANLGQQDFATRHPFFKGSR